MIRVQYARRGVWQILIQVQAGNMGDQRGGLPGGLTECLRMLIRIRITIYDLLEIIYRMNPKTDNVV